MINKPPAGVPRGFSPLGSLITLAPPPWLRAWVLSIQEHHHTPPWVHPCVPSIQEHHHRPSCTAGIKVSWARQKACRRYCQNFTIRFRILASAKSSKFPYQAILLVSKHEIKSYCIDNTFCTHFAALKILWSQQWGSGHGVIWFHLAFELWTLNPTGIRVTPFADFAKFQGFVSGKL